MLNLWSWIEHISALLEPAERQSVLGDIQERGRTIGALFDLLGLVFLRQLQNWLTWRPWAMIFSLAIPSLYAGFMTNPIASIIHSGYFISVASQRGVFLTRPLVALLAGCLAWAIGFSIGRLGQRRAASLVPLAIGVFTYVGYGSAVSTFREPLEPIWLARFHLSATFSEQLALTIQTLNLTSRFVATMLFVILLTAIPCVLGFRRGLRNGPLHPLSRLLAMVICLGAMYQLEWRLGPSILGSAALWPVVYALLSRRVYN